MLQIIEALKPFIRVNVTLKTVEFYDEFGVKLVLKDLDDETFKAFKALYQNY